MEKALPIIRIVSEEEELFVNLGLEMDDSTHDMLVEWGKEVATDEDFVQIAMTHGIKNGMDGSSQVSPDELDQSI
jgi:hypothetical protein